MAPDWDKLGEEYAGSKSVVIGDVDCTTDEGKPVCEAHSVRGCTSRRGSPNQRHVGGGRWSTGTPSTTATHSHLTFVNTLTTSPPPPTENPPHMHCADPTIKYFNSETGEGGGDYSGGREFDDLNKFVKENLAAKCLLEDTSPCSEKELGYIEKMKAAGADEVKKQLERLTAMKGRSMAPDLKAWLAQRVAILEQLAAA